MFFKLLKLVGIDVTRKLAELKADFELEVERNQDFIFDDQNVGG